MENTTVSTTTPIHKTQLGEEYTRSTYSAKHLKASTHAKRFIKRYARLMDKWGADALLGLFGPYVDLGLGIMHSAVTVYRGEQVNLPRTVMIKIIARHGLDVLIGLIPVIGDLADFGVRSNLYAKECFDRHHERLIQTLIQQGVQLPDGYGTVHDKTPSERYEHWSLEGIFSKIENYFARK